MQIYDVRDYGATGVKSDDARPAIQKAIDACAEAGGGMVYVPPGEYTTGMLHLRSNLRFFLEAGATLLLSRERAEFDCTEDWRAALFFGEDLHHVSLEGFGVVDGRAEYEWRDQDFDDRYIGENLVEHLAAGGTRLRAFPKKELVTARLVLLLRCTDVRVTGLSFVRSPSWTMNYYACRRVTIDGIRIHTSLKEGVWADGIDPDGCSDVLIANSVIETGDDAIVFYAADIWGPALPCENITVTNCRLSSASSAIKFCDGNKACVRNVVIDNCVITDSNRGIAFMTFDGGYVSDVVISNCTIDTRRFDWFWWGDGDPFYFMSRRRFSELHPELKREDPPAGAIRNVLIRDIIAHGKARCLLRGHPEQWLEGVRFDNVRFFLSADPKAGYDKPGGAITVRYARDISFKDVEVVMEEPTSKRWTSPLVVEDAAGLSVDGFRGTLPKGSGAPAISLERVAGAVVRDSRAEPETGTFLSAGAGVKDVVLMHNDLRAAAKAADGKAARQVTAVGNLGRAAPARRRTGGAKRRAAPTPRRSRRPRRSP
jgi:hypothetical protein